MRTAVFLAVAAVVCARPLPAEPVYDAHTRAELISEVSVIAPGEPFRLGLRLKTDPHWHTYWRNPGDSGLAASLRWTLPDGFTASPILWPYPQRINLENLTSYGYEDETLLLTEITPPDDLSEDVVTIKARADWLACEVPCVPGRADFTLTLDVAAQTVIDQNHQGLFQQAFGRLPETDRRVRVEALDQKDVWQLDVLMPAPDNTASAEFFPYADSLILHPEPQRFERLSPESFRLALAKNLRGQQKNISSIDGVLVLHDSSGGVSRALEISAPVVSGDNVPEGAGAGSGAALMLVFAFLGGMILNLMPCVFPVLSIKVLSFVERAHSRPALLRLAVGYTLGVTGTFFALAAVVIALQSAGQGVGWGFQFQSPVFVAGMIFLLYMIALNFLGLFEIRVSGFSRKSETSGSFGEAVLDGILATIVATPCTAPFMGAAMGFALTQGAVMNFLIFASLGLGMAFPLVMLCLFPSALKALPKPGAWMEHFKKFLAFPLLATVIWLLWVLEAQQGFASVLLMLSALLLLAFGVWLLNVVRSPVSRCAAFLTAASALVFPLVHVSFSDGKTEAPKVLSGTRWISYDAVRVAQLEDAGRVIFFDFTARWCLTCQANERLVLSRADVMKAFEDNNVAPVKGDWTARDETITGVLNKFGRNSVPLYVVSRPSEQGRVEEVLPELLTPGLVIDAVSNANQPN